MHIGRHISIAGGITNSIDRADALGCDAMQVFTRNPRAWNRGSVSEDAADSFIAKRKKSGVKVVVSHMPYLPNIGSRSGPFYSKSVEALRDELRVCNRLGIDFLVSHLGSHLAHGVAAGIESVVEAVHSVAEDIGACTLVMENEAGQKGSVGSTLDELARIHDMCDVKRLGFCLDTCHLFAAGYDVRKDEELDRMAGILDFDKVRVVHLNDAKAGLGSHLDRHANIGRGEIGTAGISSVLHTRHLKHCTFILETPPSRDISEADELELVRKLAKGRADAHNKV